MLQRIAHFQIEPGSFRISNQQAITFQAAQHTQHNHIEQVRHHGWRRRRQRMEAQLTVLVGVDAIQHQHVQMDIEIQRAPEALDERDDTATGTAFPCQSGTPDQRHKSNESALLC